MNNDAINENSSEKEPQPKKKRQRHRGGTKGLSVRERAFVHAFRLTMLQDGGKGNARKAAIMIGCPEKTAGNRGCGFMKLPKVKEGIQALIEEHIAKFEISSEKILQEIATMAFANMSSYLKFGEDGSAVIDWSMLSSAQTAAIKSVKIDEVMEKDGGVDENGKPTWEKVKKITFELHDKKGSLELLGRHHKLFTDNVAVQNPDGSAIESAAPVFNIQFLDPADKP